MSKLHRIEEFGCPYSVFKCENCKWNYTDTCNFDFDSYQHGRADERANVIVEVMDFIKYECCIDDSVTKVFEFLEQLKEQK